MHQAWLIATVATVSACQSAIPPRPVPARYLVTERAIDVGDGIRICLAVDVADAHGIWWWGAGRSGCATRSTGPGLMTADAAAVSPGQDGGHTVRFRLGTHSLERPFMDVRLLIEASALRREGASDKVLLVPRGNLEIPEEHPGAVQRPTP